ncbi:MAG: QueT transporter family protein [Ruminococcus sp.]|nr:QueT transporter family protein [Ruminococcus sp.]
MKFLWLKKKIIETNDIKKIIKLLKKINLSNLDNEELESIISIVDSKMFFGEYHAFKNFLKYFASKFIVSLLGLFIGNLIGINVLKWFSVGMSPLNIISTSLLLTSYLTYKSRNDIVRSTWSMPSKESLNSLEKLKASLKENYRSRILEFENKPVKESQSLALISVPKKEVPKQSIPIEIKTESNDIISSIVTDFNRILDIEDSINLREKFIELANSLPNRLQTEDAVTINKALDLVGEYFVVAAKKPNMQAKVLLYYLNPHYFKSVVKALEKELDNIVDDVDTIINVCKLTSDKSNYTDFAYMNKLLEIYMNYNNRNKGQVLARK